MKLSTLRNVLTKTIPAQEPVLIKSAPGVGKTDTFKQVCKALVKEKVIDSFCVLHPALWEPTDAKGLPGFVDGEACFKPYGYMKKLFDTNERIAVLLDDLGQADMSVQKGCMQLLHERAIDDARIGDNVTFCAATNRKSDKAGVTAILEPVKSRFMTIVDVEADTDEWITWAAANNQPVEMMAYMKYKPGSILDFKATQDITNSPNPRTIAAAGRALELFRDAERPVLQEVLAGAVGEGFALELVAFLKVYMDLPDPRDVLRDPESFPIPSDPEKLYALCGGLAHHAVSFEGSLENLFVLASKVPKEFGVCLVDMCKRMHGSEFEETMGYIEWLKGNQEVIF
jgi:hypothetical protein